MTSASTNSAWTIPLKATSTKDLTLISKPIPTPGPHQVLVKITAAALNYRDVLISSRSPQYPGDHKESLVPGSDGAGLIHTPGPSSSWSGKEGTAVVLHPSTWLSGDISNLRTDQVLGGNDVDGTLQSWMVLDDERVIEAGKGWSAVDTSTLFTAGATAWEAIRGGLDGRLDGGIGKWEGGWKQKRLEGKTVLTQGTGGVSCFAIQIAAALGATVIATSSSNSKLQVAKSLGATHLVNYKDTPDWDQEVLRLTNGKGVDQVIEVGGAATLMKSLASVRNGGLISVIGILTAAAPLPAEFVPTVLFGGKIVKGFCAFSKDTAQEFVKFAEANELKPVIAKVFEFRDMVEAFEVMQNPTAVGKFVIKISE